MLTWSPFFEGVLDFFQGDSVYRTIVQWDLPFDCLSALTLL